MWASKSLGRRGTWTIADRLVSQSKGPFATGLGSSRKMRLISAKQFVVSDTAQTMGREQRLAEEMAANRGKGSQAQAGERIPERVKEYNAHSARGPGGGANSECLARKQAARAEIICITGLRLPCLRRGRWEMQRRRGRMVQFAGTGHGGQDTRQRQRTPGVYINEAHRRHTSAPIWAGITSILGQFGRRESRKWQQIRTKKTRGESQFGRILDWLELFSLCPIPLLSPAPDRRCVPPFSPGHSSYCPIVF
jgi:hypothetical protein